MTGRLEGKVCIITGAAQGMGEATARLFATHGAKVALGDVNVEKLEAVAKDIGGDTFFQKLDVSDDKNWKTFSGAVRDKFGTIDVLVNNAGLVHFTPIEMLDPSDFNRILGVNTLGPILGTKHVTPIMKAAGKGSIINISSVDGLRGANGLTCYTASKWALRGITKCHAFELGTSGIRVNSVHPGGVDTPMGNAAGRPKEEVNQVFKRLPLGRIGDPTEIAQASLFLASDEASYITGAEIAVDGGWTAGTFLTMLPGSPEGLMP